MTEMAQIPWWQRAVFYQIYPRSFADGNGDGIGDIPGITARLDYLADLGIDAIWLSPHYPSPQFDCGYDVADYTAVNSEYGSLDDFRKFLAGAHQRGIRVILDLVLNHTSDQHSWFIESRSGRENPRRDWYIWRDGRDGGPPNDWLSTFGGSAWEHDPATGQYYYHFFFKEQPDLNWRNPAVKQAMFDAVRFWLDMGVDGFRLDAIGTIYEDPDMIDHDTGLSVVDLRRATAEARTEPERRAAGELWMSVFGRQVEQPGVHDLMKELRQLVDEYDDRVLVGETDHVAYLGNGSDELHMVFNFPLMRESRLDAQLVRQNQVERLAALPAESWPCNTLGNHDTTRVFSHLADGLHDQQLAHLAIMLMLTLRGTPFLYYGEEIGMTDLLLDDVDQFRDLWGVWNYEALQAERGLSPQEALHEVALITRDRCRTPMQWSGVAHGGFCPAKIQPWLPVHPNHAAGVSVAHQARDPHSLWSFYRSLLNLRRETPALQVGDYQPLQRDEPDLLVFRRSLPGQSLLVVLNWGAETSRLAPGAELSSVGRVLFSTHRPPGQDVELPQLPVAPFEGLIFAVG